MLDKIGVKSTPIIKPLQNTAEAKEIGAADLGKSFGEMLNNALNQLSVQEKGVEQLNGAFIRGDSVDVHQLMINAERLSLGLGLTVQVRNKAIEAYQEIMRTQI